MQRTHINTTLFRAARSICAAARVGLGGLFFGLL